MSSVDARVAAWVDIVADLLSQPLTTFPSRLISTHLVREFKADVVSHVLRGPDGTVEPPEAVSLDGYGFGGRQLHDAIELAELIIYERGLLDHHPLVRWFAVSEDPLAQTMGRVPSGIAGTERLPELQEVLHFFDIPQQMSVPVMLQGPTYRAFVSLRSGREDFSQEDLVV